MQAVLWAWFDVFSGKMTADQRKAMKWVLESITNVTVNAPEGSYEVLGTLLSG